MRNLKKFLALVLAMVMAFSLMLTANATTTGTQYNDVEGVTPAFEEAVDVLTGMKVFQGDAEAPTFRPASSITRAEVAAVIYRLVTGDVTDAQANLYTTRHPFTDVASNAWYAGYVGYLYNAKIIKGTTATTFNPRDSVTGYEVLAMILRAVGYDKNGEFTGNTWRVEVASTSKSLGILKDVDTTIYGGTLHLAARRDVVASLLFNTAAYVPMVQYTLAFGYQDTGMEGGVTGSTKNPTLGYKIFGLTHNTGVVVGNEVTGEAAGTTKIGFSLKSATSGTTLGIDGTVDGTGQVVTGVITANQTAFVTAIDDSMPIGTNLGSAYVYSSDTTNARPENVTRSFNFSTDLRLFNHAVKVWYDNRSSQYETVGDIDGTTGTAQFTTNLTTYAYFDKVTNVSVVSLDAAADLGTVANMAAGTPDNLAAAAVNSTVEEVANNWQAPGFTLRNDGTNYLAYFNYSFGRIAPANYGSDAATAAADSPVLDNNAATDHNLYLLISNSANKSLDVVIPLDMTMTQIVQANTTTAPYSVGVLTSNGGNQYFGVVADNGVVNGAAGATKTYTSLAQANLKNSPKTDLGTRVAAIEITGTAGTQAADLNVSGNVGADGGMARARTPLTSTFYYQLTENTLKRTATVIRVDYGTQDVTLSDGTVLHQSVFAEATDGSFTTQMDASIVTDTGTFIQAGRDYTFTLDEQGHYIYWETASNTAKFVYGTYIDFTTKVASSSFDYPLVYVSQNGEAKQQANIIKVTDDNVPALAGGMTMGYLAYTELQLPKRDNASASAATSGFEKGRYVGYALDDKGNLVAVTDSNSQDTGFFMADTDNFGAGAITINKTDVAITAKAVDSANKLYLTNNTQFYLVDGAGTDNQKVTAYKGLAELMAGMDSVIIDGKTAIASSSYLDPLEDPYEMIYYQAGAFQYAQSYDPSAEEIKTVFIPAACVDFNKSIDDSLVFIGDSDSTLVSAISAKATRYTMYKDGVAGDYWIAGWEQDANTAANAIDTNGDNVFYRLVDTGKTAADGQPIYTIRSVGSQAAASKIIIGKFYNGDTAANGDITTSTEWTLDPGAAALTTWAKYYATTYSSQVGYITCDANTDDLYNVGSATVKNLDLGTYPGINDTLTALNNASSLVNNVGVPVSCVLNTADTNARTVSIIYVNANNP